MALWTPADIVTQLWLDASDAATITHVSNAVSNWNDKSGNGILLDQTTANRKPTLAPASQNGLDTLSFDGSLDLLTNNDTPNGIGRNVSSLLLIACRKVTDISVDRLVLQASTGASFTVPRLSIYSSAAGKAVGFTRRIDSNSGTTEAVTSVNNVSTTDFETQIAVFDYANGAIAQYINGTLDGSASGTVYGSPNGNTSDTNSQRLRIGSTIGGTPGSYFLGNMAEIIVVHNDISVETRQKIEGYLAHKWGIAGSLPADHPYKSDAPSDQITGVAECFTRITVYAEVGTAECHTAINVVEFGGAECHTAINVLSLIEAASQRVYCPVTITVRDSGTVECHVRISVSLPQGVAECFTRLSVREQGTAVCHTRIVVLGTSTWWKPRVLLNGLDVSARLTGRISVEPGEGAARIADFELVPEDGPINPFALSGATVIIEYLSIEGEIEIPQRLFTGRVDFPEYDPGDRVIRFSCTDDLQNRVAKLTRDQIDALIGGRYATAVQGEQLDNWDYAQARLSTVAGSLDASAYGAIRVTPWAGLPLWRTFTLATTLDKSIVPVLPRRTSLINQVKATFELRHARLRQRVASIHFRADLDAVVENGLPLLTQATVSSALDATGWEVLTDDYVEFPQALALPNGGIWINTSDDTCMEANATLKQRWAQTITEDYNLTITAPQSIAANGQIIREERGSLESEWDAEAWEQDTTAAPVLTGTAAQDYMPDITGAVRDNALEALIDVGVVIILASHRSGRVPATVPILPALDLDKACRVNIPTVKAAGKVVEARHVMDLDSGSALTEFSIAISGHGAVGIEVSDTPVAAPPSPAVEETAELVPAYLGTHVGALETSPAYSDSLQGWLVNAPAAFNVSDQGGNSYEYTVQTQQETQQDYSGSVLNPAYVEVKAFPTQGFRVILPAVEDDERQPATAPSGNTFQVNIPEDEFLLSA